MTKRTKTHVLRRLTRSDQRADELDEELEFHIEGRAAELIEEGWASEEARTEALRQFGDAQRIRKECRHIERGRMVRERRGEMTGHVMQDIRFALRSFRRNPGFATVAVLTLGLGIGATTAVFTVAKDVLFDPLPFHEPDRLVMVWEKNAAQNIARDRPSPPNFADWRRRNTSFVDLAAMSDGSVTISGLDQPAVMQIAYVTPNTFELLGVEAQIGRTLGPDEAATSNDDQIDGASLVVISDGLWKTAFGADPEVVGRTVLLNGTPVEIVGVMPPTFDIPRDDIDLWLGVDYGSSAYHRQSRYLHVFGRLQDDVDVDRARADLDRIQAAIAEIHPEANQGWTTEVVPVHDEVVGEGARSILLVLLGAVGFVLLLACANVANLLLGRSSARAREICVRTALGARRARVVGQLMTESLVLGLMGGTFGAVLAFVGVRLLLALEPAGLPRIDEVAVDLSSLAFGATASILTALLFGLAPAIQASRRSVADALKGSAGSGSRPARRMRATLVVAEIAVSLVLLVGAGLLTRSLLRQQAIDPGFETENVIVARVSLGGEYATNDDKVRYFDTMLGRFRETPGVLGAGVTSVLPMDPAGIDFDLPYLAEGRPARPEGELPQTSYRIASDGYFEAMGMDLVRGRGFSAMDRPETQRVLVIDEALASQLWPGQDPVGRTITIYYVQEQPWEVVGVVESTRHRGLGVPPPAQLYVPLSQAEFLFGYMHFAVRTDGSEGAVGAIRAIGAEVDPRYPLYSVATMASILAATTERDRFVATLLGAFALLALCLAAIGIHGVVAVQVAERTREIGLRMAMGASRSTMLRSVLARAAPLALAGIGLGCLGAVAMTRVIQSLLVDVSPLDPVTFAATSSMLFAVALVAALVPAFRAATMDPAGALRSD